MVQIERPGVGDETRSWGPPFVNGQSTYFLAVNRNKHSVAIDFQKEEGTLESSLLRSFAYTLRLLLYQPMVLYCRNIWEYTSFYYALWYAAVTSLYYTAIAPSHYYHSRILLCCRHLNKITQLFFAPRTGRELVCLLAEQADVLIENYLPGILDLEKMLLKE